MVLREAYGPYLRDLAARHPNAEYLEVLTDAICGPEVCPMRLPDGRSRYRDGDHLSAAGALSLAPALSVLFAPPED